MPRSRMLVPASQAHRPPRQVKPGTAPGQGSLPGTQSQPAFVATDAQRAEVKKLVACGFIHESIAVIMSIPLATLERHFRFELQHGKTLIDAKILGGIVEMALERDRTMAIFYARSRGGWRQDGDAEMSGNASPVFSINISHGSPSTPDTGHRISITALPLQPEEEP